MPSLHIEAVRSFNTKANELLVAVKARPAEASNQSSPPSSDAHVAHHLDENDIDLNSLREKIIDFRGVSQACFFYSETKGMIGLFGPDHDELLRLVKRVSSHKIFSEILSEEFIYDCAIDWLRMASQAQPAGSSLDFVGFLESACAKSVSTHEVWLPFPGASIPFPIQIGKVWFRKVTKSMLDEMATRVSAGTGDSTPANLDSLRKIAQGTTAACITVHAEPSKANQIVTAETEASIAIFRLACPALLTPHKWAPVSPEFIDSRGGRLSMIVRDGNIERTFRAFPSELMLDWSISPAEARHFQLTQWQFGHALLTANRNDFQEQLLGALVHYSKSMLKPEVSERLMYVVTALESLLILKSEPIVQNLSERLAILTSTNVADRLSVLQLIKRVYDVRSRFVHAALPVAEMEQLAEFFLKAWSTFFFILNNHNLWKTKAEFLNFIDSHKFAA